MKHLLPVLLLAQVLFLAACRPTHPRDGEARGVGASAAGGLSPTVLLVSIDGFRSDYLERYRPPHLAALAREGVHAEGLVPVFPTKTFPNHYSIVTGLYPEHHGIIANNMYDPTFDGTFSLGDREAVRDARWWGGEPIWVTAERQGQRTATLFWPGSEAPIQGVHPTYWLPYDHDMPDSARVDQLLAWLDLPAPERPTFLTLYFSEVDTKGHRYGPEAEETRRAVLAVDRQIGRLMAGLRARGLADAVNVLVVSDHGMVRTAPERVILLDDYIDLEDVRVVDLTPVAMLRPAPGRTDAVYDALRGAHPHLTVYRRGELPPALHFDAHPRIPEIIALADVGWNISTRDRFEAHPEQFAGGTHGYDSRHRLMQGLFVARGPAFAEGRRVPRFENVHLYSLMSAVLGLRPAATDGRLEAVRHLLRATPVPDS